MELRNPFILILGLIGLSILFLLKIKKENTYTNGKKIANTQYVKNLTYYTELMKKYKMLTYCVKGICAFCILLCIVLLARPAKETESQDVIYSRDIFLCMDVSTSVDKVNKELAKNLKETVKNLKGERFGITIFNTSSVVIVPLTDDYDYVIEALDNILKAIEKRIDIMEELERNNNMINLSDEEYEEYMNLQKYIQEGTLVGNEEKGSSLIGEGLASCIYNFPNLEENRTKVIIFSTDNSLNGNQIITLQQAAEIAKSKNITVYGIAPEDVQNAVEYKNAVEITGGNFYVENKVDIVSKIIEDIKTKEKKLIKTTSKIKMIDRPQEIYMLLVGATIILFILTRKMKI